MKNFFIEYIMPFSRDLISAGVAFIVAYFTSRWEIRGIKQANKRNYWRTKFKEFCDRAKVINDGIIDLVHSSKNQEKEIKHKKLSQEIKEWSNSLDEIYDKEALGEYKLNLDVEEFHQIGKSISDTVRDETFYGIIPKKGTFSPRDRKKIEDLEESLARNTLKLQKKGEKIIKHLSSQ